MCQLDGARNKKESPAEGFAARFCERLCEWPSVGKKPLFDGAHCEPELAGGYCHFAAQ